MTTVIIPFYKRKNTIKIALESCKYIKDLENILIVDDELSSSSEMFLHNLSIKNKLIKILKNTQKGAYSARYIGLKNNKSKIVLFLDSDDQFLPDVQKMIDKYKDSLEPMIICSSYLMENIEVIHKNSDNAKKIILSKLSASPFSAIALFNVLKFPKLNLNLGAYQDDDFCIRCSQYPIKINLEKIVTSKLNTKNSLNRISNSFQKKHQSFKEFIKYPINLSFNQKKYILFLKFNILLLMNILLIITLRIRIIPIYLGIRFLMNKICYFFMLGVEPL